MIFVLSPDSFGEILIMAQVYEWSIMIFSVWYQSGKSLIQVMHLLRQEKERKRYRAIEHGIRNTLLTLDVIIISAVLSGQII